MGNIAANQDLTDRREKFFAVVNVAEHSGFVTSRRNDEEWRYQDFTAPHGTVLEEGYDKQEIRAALDRWLECDSAQYGTYCYTHNPVRR